MCHRCMHGVCHALSTYIQGVSRLFAIRDAHRLFLLDVSHLVIDGRLREMELDESCHILYDQVSIIVCLPIYSAFEKRHEGAIYGI